MNVKSLGYRTDLVLSSFVGEIVDRGDYLVILTPTSPTFYWGNYLLFSRPPQEGDLETWLDLFACEIGVPPEIEHQAFGWDSPEGEEGAIQPFLQAGFRPNHGVVMTSTGLRPPAWPSNLVTVRALKAEADWEQAVNNQVICREPEFDETGYREFRQRQMDCYRRMVRSGLADWFGAFVDQRLVADLGIIHDKGIGRFQSVQTHPNFRRRGIAGRLIVDAGRQTMAKHDLHTLVIVAESDSGPARLYQSLGFEPTEKQVGLEWWPEIDLDSRDGG